jgi:myo-inositol catabolism protein IolC
VRGYSRPLYILPFDHRGSFVKGLFGVDGEPDPATAELVTGYKDVVYDGFLAACRAGVPHERAGILVDEEYGAEIARRALAADYVVALPVEKSGQDEFDFEYGEDFAAHIEAFNPTFAKVLVRYNPDGDAELNRRQAERLARLSGYLEEREPRLMFELLVPAEPGQLAALGADGHRFDAELRPALTVRAIEALRSSGVDPDVWKVEGMERSQDCAAVGAAARAGGRDEVGVIVLGRGENDREVELWLAAARQVPAYIGFAVGRTTFWDALMRLRQGTHDREAAVAEIARNYLRWVADFTGVRPR